MKGGLGNGTCTDTETPVYLHTYTGVSVSIQVPLPRPPFMIHLAYKYYPYNMDIETPLMCGYWDSLGISITYSTCTVTEALPCTDTETRTDTETHTDNKTPPLYGYPGGLGIGTTDNDTPVYYVLKRNAIKVGWHSLFVLLNLSLKNWGNFQKNRYASPKFSQRLFASDIFVIFFKSKRRNGITLVLSSTKLLLKNALVAKST